MVRSAAGKRHSSWEELHAKGLRPTGVGGGDEHRGGEQLSLHDGVGIPTTVVYARELSQPAILEGIKAGHRIHQNQRAGGTGTAPECGNGHDGR